MEKRILGKTGMSVTVLGYGGAEIGYRGVPEETVERLINGALDAGLNVIDTAECYVDSEEKIGKVASRRRNEYFLFTKCGHDKDGDHWNPKKMAEQIDRSLKRLQTDRLDLLQLHSCTEEQLRQGDVIHVVQRARDAGKTRFIGYSGDGQAALYAVQSSIFDTLQISVSIADQEALDLVLPAARAKEIGVIAKRPIANAVWKESSKPSEYYQPYWERLQQLDYDFLRTNSSQDVATALRFTLSAEGVHTAIVGTTKPERWKQNAELLQAGRLDRERINAIRSRWKAVAAPDWVGQT
ncbi:MAG TPA: aldo/keto reductase [Bryobacteraceae bacterium]|jgi:aryl-alcohol dehydrogenase-like predicted oxidoreductase|nr:aldo/keto reductase [Bryobacteraceae bacterium]